MGAATIRPDAIRILIAGCGNMGASHARAYRSIPGVEIAGLVSRGPSKQKLAQSLALDLPLFDDFDVALAKTSPDAVCIATYPDTHERFALSAIAADCDLFVEKPLAPSAEAARRVITAAQRKQKQLVVGYILRHHPTWQKFIAVARTLGHPLILRMNLNQQSSADAWRVHRGLLASASPIVDCGVHYIDVMCQMVPSKPLRVSAIGACLDPTLPRCNYGQLQITFEDGSVGWYEAGWGPMMSETAYFVKDVIGPLGSVSIQSIHTDGAGASADVNSHTSSNAIRIHHAELDASGSFARPDEWLQQHDEPDHDALCRLEQEFFVRAVRERFDLSTHLAGTFASLAIVLAADEAMRTGQSIDLSHIDVPAVPSIQIN